MWSRGDMYAMGHVCRSGDNLKELVLSFYYMSTKEQTQVIRAWRPAPYPMNYPAGSLLLLETGSFPGADLLSKVSWL